MRLLMVRHGKSMEREEWSRESDSDFERPLTSEGLAEFEKVAIQLRKIVSPIDQIFSSPLRRTVQTADILRKQFSDAKYETSDVLVQSSSFKDFHSFLLKLEWSKDQVVAVVGHENYLSSMLSRLISSTDEVALRFKKGGVAYVDLGLMEGKISGQLLWFLPPKIISKLSS